MSLCLTQFTFIYINIVFLLIYLFNFVVYYFVRVCFPIAFLKKFCAVGEGLDFLSIFFFISGFVFVVVVVVVICFVCLFWLYKQM